MKDKRLLGPCLLLGMLLVLAGCGGDGGSDSPDDNSDPNPAQSMLPPDPDGMLLRGVGTDNAVAATDSLSPSPVAADRIDGNLLTTRLAAVIAPDATVGDVNTALAAHDAAIVSMLEGDPFVVLVIDAVADYAEAQAKAAALVKTGAFAYARPGLTLTPDPDSVASGPPAAARPSGFEARSASRLSAQQALDYVPHLVPPRVPATWNLRSMSSGDGWLVVPGIYADVPGYTEVPQLIYGDPEGRPLQPGDVLDYSAGNSGFFMLGVAAANWTFDDLTSPHTGAHPAAEEQLKVIAPRVYGLDHYEIMMAVRLNLPQGASNVTLLSTDTFDDSDGTIVRFLDRAWMALRWRRLVHDIPAGPQFLHIVSAGSWINGFGANPHASLNSIYGVATLPNLIDVAAIDGSAAELALFQAEYDAAVANQAAVGQPLGNILIVGGSDALGNESIVTVPGAQVRMVSDSVLGPCVAGVGCNGISTISMYQNSSDAAAAQAAGLAAYLWSLDEAMPLDMLLLRMQHAYSASGLPGMLDAWTAALSLDASLGEARLRRQLLDIGPEGPDGRFTEHDIEAFLSAFQALGGNSVQDWSIYDLNGDGWSGGSNRARMDLDVNNLPGFTTVNQQVAGNLQQFDETGVTDHEVLCYYAWSELYSGTPSARTTIPDCGGSLAVQLDSLRIRFSVETGQGEQIITDLGNQPFGNLNEQSIGVLDPVQGVSILESAEGTLAWNMTFSEDNLSLQGLSYRFDASADVSLTDGTDFTGSAGANGRFELSFEVTEPVVITLTGTGGGEGFITYLKLSGGAIFYEIFEQLLIVPINQSIELPPGSYRLDLIPSIHLESEFDTSGPVNLTGAGSLELSISFGQG